MLYYLKLTREAEYRIERVLYRQGKIVGGVYVGRGQEAIGVGSAIQLREGDVVLPSHRDFSTFVIRGFPLADIFANWMARADSPNRGRDNTLHIGDMKRGVIPIISPLGATVPVAACGMPGESVDGADVLAVYDATQRAIVRGRAGGGPSFLEFKTYRMTGHSAHDVAEYVPEKLLRAGEQKDPIRRFEKFLLARKTLSVEKIRELEETINKGIEAAIDAAEARPLPAGAAALEGVYCGTDCWWQTRD